MIIRHLRSALPITSVGVLLQACGASTGAGSCTVTGSSDQIGFCIQYIGSSYTTGSVQSACSAESGTYAASACATPATDNGSCDVGSGTSTEYKYIFTNLGDAGASTAQSECTALGGTYSAT
jgi:hypothetical protein